jgi:predicted AAA+ superfamily ATPase
MYRRLIQHKLMAAVKDTPAIFIRGARQTGKTTLVTQLLGQKANYVTFDDYLALSAAQSDPQNFLAGLADSAVILDEIQKVPELFPAIKLLIDRDRRPGRFIMTGSANALVLPKVSESLAGRMEVLTLWPLSTREVSGNADDILGALFEAKAPKRTRHREQLDLRSLVIAGGYPEAIARTGKRRVAWFSSYITSFIERDVRDIAAIEGRVKLPRLLSLLAARSANLLNLSDLSVSSQIPYATLNRYMALLEATYLVHQVPAWSSNLGTRLVKSPKVYFVDTGLMASLLGVDAERFTKDPTLMGSFLETFVAAELLKLISGSERQLSLYHFRTATRSEVDFVLEGRDGSVIGIEVKASSKVDKSHLKGLRTLQGMAGDKFHMGIVLHSGTELMPLGPKIWAVPLAGFLHG